MARSFNGSTQYLETTTFLQAALPCTIAAWFYTTTTATIQRVATWSDASTAYTCSSIILNYPSAGDVANQINPPNQLPYKSGLTANAWHHACAVSDTGVGRMYLNGVAGSDLTYTTSFATARHLRIGQVAGVQYLNGRACHVAVWSAALNAAEAAALAAGYCPLLVRPASLIAYYPLGGFHGDYDRDLVGGYNLTPYNSPTWIDQPRVIYPVGPHGVQLSSGGSPATSGGYIIGGGVGGANSVIGA